MGHNTVSHTVTHKYKSCVGYSVHHQRLAVKSKGPNGRSSAHVLASLHLVQLLYPYQQLLNTHVSTVLHWMSSAKIFMQFVCYFPLC